MERASDGRLVDLIRGGCENAFAEVVRRYQKPLRSHCERLVGGERAKDAVQQAFLQALVALRRESENEIVLRPWLYRISHNCAIDLLRRGGSDYEQLDPSLPADSSTPAVVEQKQRLDEVVSAIRTLPERQRRALVLREVEGRSYREIAPQLGEGASGVNQLIFRARTRLRKAVAALLPLEPLRFLLARGGAVEAIAGAGAGCSLRRMGAVAFVAAAGVLCNGDVADRTSPARGAPAPPVAVASAAGPSAAVRLLSGRSRTTDQPAPPRRMSRERSPGERGLALDIEPAPIARAPDPPVEVPRDGAPPASKAPLPSPPAGPVPVEPAPTETDSPPALDEAPVPQAAEEKPRGPKPGKGPHRGGNPHSGKPTGRGKSPRRSGSVQ